MTLDAPALRAECNLLAAEHLLMEGRRAGEMSSKTQIRVSKFYILQNHRTST